MSKRVLLAWSSGKDSAWALQQLRAESGLQVVGLFTTVHDATDRVAVHGVPRPLLREQAACAGLALHEVSIPSPCPNAIYERELGRFVEQAKRDGVQALAFGDLFLEEIRRYRERQFAASGIELLFPLWGLPTRNLAEEMTGSGLRAWITVVDAARAPREWAGCCYDAQFVSRIPRSIDPCGENGEFHSFAFAGPMFARPVRAQPGAVRERDGFVYADLVSSAPC
jgi:uncharacterized protein (TIGR00290 family)